MDPIEQLKTVADLIATKKKLAEPLSWRETADQRNRLIRDRVKLLGNRFESMKIRELARFEFMTNEAKQTLGNLSAGELAWRFGVPFSDSSKKFHAVHLLADIARGGPFTNFYAEELKMALDFYKKFAKERNIPLPADMSKLMATVKERAKEEKEWIKEREATRKAEMRVAAQEVVEDHYRTVEKWLHDQYEQAFGPNYELHGEYAPAAIDGVKRGPEMDHEAADGHKGNPLYETHDRAYTHNCQTCVVIYEMRRRGYDVQAAGWASSTTNPCNQLSRNFTAAWIDPATGRHPIPLFDPGVTTVKACLNWLNQNVEDGKRYILRVGWKKRRSGHVVHVYKNNLGGAIIFDPQTGILYETLDEMIEFLKDVSYDRKLSPLLLRCDNLLFNMPVINKIAKKADGYKPD